MAGDPAPDPTGGPIDGLLGGDGDHAPAADLLFGIAALMIATLAVLLHGFGSAPRRPAPPSPFEALIAEADPVLALLAAPDGVTVIDRRGDPAVSRRVATGDLLADAALPSLLAAARSGDGPVVVAIAAGGEEAAFVLEGIAARFGPDRLLQARLVDGGAER